jgi:hypothetical protein
MRRLQTVPSVRCDAQELVKARTDACHHVSRFLDEDIPDLKRALAAHAQFQKMAKHELKGIAREHARNAVSNIFGSCQNMGRLDRALAALTIVSGGRVPEILIAIHQQIFLVREKLAQIRGKYSPPACYTEQSIRTDLSGEVGPLCDELRGLIIAMYAVAKPLYALPELNGRGMQ